MKLPGIFCGLLFLLVDATRLFAQAPAPAAPNLIPAGSFERGTSHACLWDGVDLGGNLAGFQGKANVLSLAGVIIGTPMPVSVSVADLNDDGLLDIVAIDSLGYIRVYFNHGTKTEPKFTIGEMSYPFLAADPNYRTRDGLGVPRGTLVDFGEGKKDLVIGNYRGDILHIKNAGSVKVPTFQQPVDFAKVTINTMKDPLHRWGNVFSPAMVDWNNDGKLDLLLGEGSYSANNVHLLINQSGNGAPKFNEEQHYITAYGDGREQLNIALVDYNGDGKLDLLVSDRSGKIGIYLNYNEGPWKPGGEFPLDSNIKVNGVDLTFRDICTLAIGDLNGDGLFDIIVGKTNGRIAFVKNIGTKQAPKFDVPVEIAGTPYYPKMVLPSPSEWDIDIGQDRGNFYGVAEIVNAEKDKTLLPPQGNAALRLGYVVPPHDTLIKPPHMVYPGEPAFDINRFKTEYGERYHYGIGYILKGAPSNLYGIETPNGLRLKVDHSYTLTFKTKGTAVKNALVRIIYHGLIKAEGKIVRGERGAISSNGIIEESGGEATNFSPSKAWSEIKVDFTVRFKERALRELKTTEFADVQIYAELENGTGEIFFDDLKLVEKTK